MECPICIYLFFLSLEYAGESGLGISAGKYHLKSEASSQELAVALTDDNTCSRTRFTEYKGSLDCNFKITHDFCPFSFLVSLVHLVEVEPHRIVRSVSLSIKDIRADGFQDPKVQSEWTLFYCQVVNSEGTATNSRMVAVSRPDPPRSVLITSLLGDE